MATKLPQRPESHQLADESEKFFRQHLPREWTCDRVDSDYGVDFRLGLVTDDGQVTGNELLVQLKSSATDDAGETVPVSLKVSTYRYLSNMLPVALLVKYVKAEGEAYWLLWKDIVAPSDDQDTFTVRVPRTNRLTRKPWPEIERHVGRVHERKLGAMYAPEREVTFSRPLNQIPAPPPDFRGRAGQMETLLHNLRSTCTGLIYALRGIGGIGKTTLAALVAQRAADAFPDGLLWLELRGSRPGAALSAETAIGRVLHSFDPVYRLPTDLTSLRTHYLAVLRDKRCLIVLDDARNAEQIKPLVPPAPAAVIVTSRLSFQLPGMRSLELPVMAMAEAMALMQEILSGNRPEISDSQLESIATLCGRLPLALRAAASFLAENNDWKVEDYITALRSRRLNALRTEDPELDVRTVLGFSHAQLLDQQPALARYWRLLAVIPSHFDVRAAAAVWGCDEDSAQDALSALRRRAMLEYDSLAGRYRFHDLMRDLAEEEFKKLGESLDV